MKKLSLRSIFILTIPTLVWVSGLLFSNIWWQENILSVTAIPFLFYCLALIFTLFLRNTLQFTFCLPFIFLWGYIHPLDNSKSLSQCPQTLKVFQYNLRYENPSLDPLFYYLQQYPQHLLVFQETTPEHGSFLKESLRTQYPYQFGGQPRVGYPSGQLVLSQYPLFNMKTIATQAGHQIIHGIWHPPTHDPIELYTAHPPSPRNAQLWAERNTLLKTLNDLVEDYIDTDNASPAQLIVGDFNLSSTSERYQTLFGGFNSQPVSSWPNWSGLWQYLTISIDHLWAHYPLEICKRKALMNMEGSDHRPIVTYLTIHKKHTSIN